jgi:hypothetical protein
LGLNFVLNRDEKICIGINYPLNRDEKKFADQDFQHFVSDNFTLVSLKVQYHFSPGPIAYSIFLLNREEIFFVKNEKLKL